MAVKAKFEVESVTAYRGDQVNVTLRACTTGSEENKDWSKYTPNGKIEMTITNPDASAQFQPGHEFYITFEHAGNPA